MQYSLGIDIGSVSAKLALIDGDSSVVALDAERITSGPRDAFNALLCRLATKVDPEDVVTAGSSGCGNVVIPEEFNWSEYSSSLAVSSGVLHRYPDTKTIVSVGGQSSLVIGLEDGLRKPWRVASNPLCAAGTGRFLDQQAYRIGITLDDFARLALSYDGIAPRIAARCSVFAKSDLIHLQQKGVPVEAMLWGLSGSIARMVVSLTKDVFEEPVYFVGGVAANGAILKSLSEAFSERNGYRVSPIIPQDYLHIEALGSALLAAGSDRTAEIAAIPYSETERRHFAMPPLPRVEQQDGWEMPAINEPFVGYLGVDVGSTSTKAVVLDETGQSVMAKNYLMTSGRPIDAVKNVFRNLLADLGELARIAGVGVTGSGRYLVGSVIGADLVKNEITAQNRSAAEIAPHADIIEIGGQDSKLVIKRNGVVVDYQMNKACAAGTGSFIDELAEMLGVSVKNGEFARLAFDAPHTVDLGTRCAAFMGQAVASVQREGVSLKVIIASLASSIVGNYLSKVVENRKLSDEIVLTGAVFYNDAVVSAFKRALEGKTIIIPEHKEISGAIGVAMLAKETMAGRESEFKGFQQVIDAQHTLSTFTCKSCDNNCTISRLVVPGEKATFYGSRCDRYDSALIQESQKTAFDEREKLLFREYKEASGTGLTVGIPRALLVYDYIPLLIGFLNSLGVDVTVSGKTNQQIMERAVELSYTDSCFPVKLAHGHVAALEETDYILFPCFIRMGLKEGEENQKYACPLVQAAPFIVKQSLDQGKRILIPIVDFSRGENEVVRSLTSVAIDLGFSASKGKRAALVGLSSQRRFERAQAEEGKKLLQQLRENNQLGVVLFSRSYMAQDTGANLGIAEKLAQLGVVPVPLDYLHLSSVDARSYSDRPYWMSESKHIAAAAITAQDHLLYGLVLTNFGCGPNSFMLNLVEDIMGDKPLGQLEIDEHAAEAGIVTRLEAFVDTVTGFHQSGHRGTTADVAEVYRSAPTVANDRKTILLPQMSPHIELLGATMQAYGLNDIVLPEADERNLLYSDRMTSGKECLPYRVTLGDFMRFYRDDGYGTMDMSDVEGYMAGSFGPCRLGKYALEQRRLLQGVGFDLPIRTTVSNNAYADMGLGAGFERLAWRSVVVTDYLQKMLWSTRPYEKEVGATDQLFRDYFNSIADRIRVREPFDDLLEAASRSFQLLKNIEKPRRPLVGINGEIYLRSNDFSNNHLIRVCEDAGLEVVVSPMGEWINYVSYRNLEDAIQDRQFSKILSGHLRRWTQRRIEDSIAKPFRSGLNIEEPSVEALLAMSREYLSPRCGSEAVLSIGSGVEWLENPRFAGVISVMPHGCMPGGIVAAMSEKFATMHGKPWINLTYDGSAETNNLVRISNFAEVIRFCHGGVVK